MIRIISRIDIKGTNVIKGISFEGLRVVGKPNLLAKKYYEQGADEILYIDTVATLYGRNNLIDLLEETVKNIFIPVNVAGGLNSLQTAKSIIRAGADKISINSSLINNPSLLDKLSTQIGSSNITVSVEAIKQGTEWKILTHNGRENPNINVLNWIDTINQFSFGEILITSVDADGTRKGFDYDLINLISDRINAPLIISGGFGSFEHIDKLLQTNEVDGIAIGTALHYDLFSITKIKEEMYKKGYKVRIS